MHSLRRDFTDAGGSPNPIRKQWPAVRKNLNNCRWQAGFSQKFSKAPDGLLNFMGDLVSSQESHDSFNFSVAEVFIRGRMKSHSERRSCIFSKDLQARSDAFPNVSGNTHIHLHPFYRLQEFADS